jgi:hypothetical protein
LTLIIYGIGKAVIKMSFGDIKSPKPDESIKYLPATMYIPQIIFITAALILGIFMPSYIDQIINNAVLAISSI